MYCSPSRGCYLNHALQEAPLIPSLRLGGLDGGLPREGESANTRTTLDAIKGDKPRLAGQTHSGLFRAGWGFDPGTSCTYSNSLTIYGAGEFGQLRLFYTPIYQEPL